MMEKIRALELKHQVMLLAVLLLGVMKFVLVPILEWQESYLDEIKIKQNKLVKIQDAIENQDLYAMSINTFNQRLQEAGTSAYEIQDMTGFQIAQQNIIENMLTDSGLKVTRLGWTDSTALGVEDMALLDVRFTGMTKAAFDFIAKVEAISPGPKVFQYNYEIRGHRNKALGTVTGFVRLSYPYRVKNV